MQHVPGYAWESAGVTDVGTVRKINEDAYLNAPERQLWVVADGMGGYEAGDFASRAIVEQMSAMGTPDSLDDAIEQARSHLTAANLKMCEQAALRNVDVVGSTVVVLLVRGTQAACLWAGDCRLYRMRGGTLEQLTQDHSRVQELVAAGVISREQARDHPNSNIVTRALGVSEELDVDEMRFDIAAEDAFVLCSDGLTDSVTDDVISAAMVRWDCEHVARDLLEQAIAQGAKDNVSLVVIRATVDEKTVINPDVARQNDHTIVKP